MNELKTLSSFALISINWQEKRRDFIDLLKPFVISGISPPTYEVISISEVSIKIKENFGITIPRNIIEVILNRLAKEKIIKRKNNTYNYITGYNLEKEIESFKKTKEKYLNDQELIIDEFMSYCKEKFNKEFTRNESEKIIFNYLDKYSYNMFLEKRINKLNIKDNENYIMGRFLDYLLEEKQSVNIIIEKVVKGFLIANSMYDENIKIDKSEMKFKNTSIYLDTSFLFYSLGYSDEELEESCTELLSLLEELGANLKAHRHVINEIKSILDAYIHLYESNRLAESYDFDYFIDNNKTPSIILLYKENLEKNLKNLNIHIEETPMYTKENVFIDHKKLEKHLRDNINYAGENADISINNDIESISSIYRIRNGQTSVDIENCKAIFMTTNSRLVNEVNSYIKNEEKLKVPQFQPIITDVNLTGIAWLKLPNKYPDLPKKNIMADAYSLQQPSREFWDLYIKEVEKLEEEKLITREDSLMLKYEVSKKDFMDITYGSKDKLSHNCIMKLLEKVRFKDQQELKLEIENQEMKILNQKKIIEKEKQGKINYINAESEKYANEMITKEHKKEICKKNTKNIDITYN